MTVMMGHISLSGQNKRVRDAIVKKAREPALLIDPCYTMPLQHYYEQAGMMCDIVDGVSPEVVADIQAVNADTTNKQQMTSVFSVSLDKIFPDKPLGEMNDIAHKLKEEFSEKTGYILVTYADRKRNLAYDENGTLVELPQESKSPHKEELLLVCDYSKTAKASFIAFMVQKGFLTDAQVDAVPELDLGIYARAIHDARCAFVWVRSLT